MPLDCNCSIDSGCSTGYFCDSNFPCSGQGDLSGYCIVEETTDVYGCMNSFAGNYNPDATVDDGSCEIQENVTYVSDIPSFGISKDTFAISPVGGDMREYVAEYISLGEYLGWSNLSGYYCLGASDGVYYYRGFTTNETSCIDCRPIVDGVIVTEQDAIFGYYDGIISQLTDDEWKLFQCVCTWELNAYASDLQSSDSTCYADCIYYSGLECYYDCIGESNTCYDNCMSTAVTACENECVSAVDLQFNSNMCDEYVTNYNKGGWLIGDTSSGYETITQYQLVVTNEDATEIVNETFNYNMLSGLIYNTLFKSFTEGSYSKQFSELDEGTYIATITATSNSLTDTKSETFEVKDIVPIVQSISGISLPWQGINISTPSMPNTKTQWNTDLDKRPSLGVFYYDDDNERRTNWLYDGFDDVFNKQVDICDEFIPDADVRMFKTTGVSNSSLWKYWDKDIQQNNYQETVAPIEVQVYLYPRRKLSDTSDALLTSPRVADKGLYKNGYYYAAYIDWGDGTPIEYNNDEPFELGYNNILKHSYEKAGIYEITGYMLKVKKSAEGDNPVVGICYNQYFTIRININEGDDNEFEYLGGDDYSTIPYKETVPIVGGVSKNSIYYKTLRRQLGYLDTDTTSPSIATDFERTGDRLRVENALATMDDTRIGQLQSTFTGSYYEGDTLIYDGSYNNFEELGESLGDIDIGQIRYFDKSIQMYELLSGNDETGTPGNEKHWQNIIPEDYSLLDREGISINDNTIDIDEEASQNWLDGYYYPVLPKLDRYGNFVEDILIPPPIPATNTLYMTGSLLINIESEYIDNRVLNDSAGKGTVGMTISDYKVNFNPKTREPVKDKNTMKIRIGKKNKAY